MPIYEYQCQACHHKLEALQKVSDPLLETCPECEEKTLRKLVSNVAFRLAGSGWYETDFKDKDKRNLKEDTAANGQDSKADAGKDKPGSSRDTPASGSDASSKGSAGNTEGKSGNGKAGKADASTGSN